MNRIHSLISWCQNAKYGSEKWNKRLGTDLVTLSIKYSAIVVETMKSVIDPDIDVIIDSEYRQIPG